MRNIILPGFSASVLTISGCAHIDFGQNGLPYYNPKPYFFVSTTADCATTASVVTLPDNSSTNRLKFVSGFGSADLSASLANGMITSAGQNTDTKVPDTITSVAGLATAAAAFKTEAAAKGCIPTATLYPITNGTVDKTSPIVFKVEEK